MEAVIAVGYESLQCTEVPALDPDPLVTPLVCISVQYVPSKDTVRLTGTLLYVLADAPVLQQEHS